MGVDTVPAVTEKPSKTSNKCAMVNEKEFTLRIFAYQKGGLYYACSVDFNLVAQGHSLQQALDRLKDSIIFYVKTELAEGKSFEQIKRTMPLYFRLKFAYIFAKAMISFFQRRVSDRYRILSAKFCDEDLFQVQYLTV